MSETGREGEKDREMERGKDREMEREKDRERKRGRDIHREKQEKVSTKIERGRLGEKKRERENFFIQWDNTDNHFYHTVFVK